MPPHCYSQHQLTILKSDNPVFAVKKIRSARENDSSFAHEVSILKKFSGQTEHLVNLLATFEHQGSSYLVFPWADGGNLLDLWKSNPNTKDAHLVKWMAAQCLGLARGLHKIHTLSVGRTEATGYRHGDIKPENILCFPSDDPGVPGGTLKISDFGLSRIHTTHSSRPSRLMGTATYRPPECDLTGDLSRSSDIWALGCVFLEFVTWYLTGSDGVIDEFPRYRSRQLPRNGSSSVEDDSFFITDSDSNTSLSLVATLKPSVKEVRRAHF